MILNLNPAVLIVSWLVVNGVVVIGIVVNPAAPFAILRVLRGDSSLAACCLIWIPRSSSSGMTGKKIGC